MSLTILEIVRRARAQLGLFPRPAVVVSSTDDTDQQMLDLAIALGEELSLERDWTALQTEWVITTVGVVTLTGTLTEGSPIVTGLSSTAALTAGIFAVTGDGIPGAARLASVDSATQVTLTERATASASVSVLFQQDVYDEPDDFLRFLSRTHWDRTNHWELVGPDSPQMDEWVRSGIVTTGPRKRYRVIGRSPSNFRVWPPPGSNDSPSTLAFEYMSRNWVTAADGTTKTSFTLDTDTCVFDDTVMVYGLKLKFFQAKLFDTTNLAGDYMRAKSIAMASDGGARTLSMRRQRWPYFISPGNIPDANFPGR